MQYKFPLNYFESVKYDGFKVQSTNFCTPKLNLERLSDFQIISFSPFFLSFSDTIKHVMCLPPPICFPPGTDVGCMIVLKCPCVDFGRGAPFDKWRSGVAFILRSKTPVPVLTSSKEGTATSGETDGCKFYK